MTFDEVSHIRNLGTFYRVNVELEIIMDDGLNFKDEWNYE